MPHQIIEVSSNLSEKLDLSELVQALHQCAAQQDALPLGGLRTRVHIASHCLIADQSPDYGFIAVYLRIAEGRPLETRQEMGTALYECLCKHIDEKLNDAPIALSYEIQEINTETRWNRNKIPEFMSQQESSS
jgi:5-carboxymethyl-2-hydroxymuconate isomerase